MGANLVLLKELMSETNVKFGTSGVRGLVTDMTSEVCYYYTTAFLQFLEDENELSAGDSVAIGGDFRESTDRILRAVFLAIKDQGYQTISFGKLPSPALAYFGFQHRMPTVMVTGSHIPEDRNGIKFSKKNGEILKQDEAKIRHQKIQLADSLFDSGGEPISALAPAPSLTSASDLYASRYMDFFGSGCLEGKRIGIYQHSAVGRKLLVDVFSSLGAKVTALGRSDSFIPVDTEAIRIEDIDLARKWSQQYGFDAIISTDGDSDRPLISDEKGQWLRGDIAGILCAQYLNADAIVTPITSNTSVERCGLFEHVERTKIGSPYVIEGMTKTMQAGFKSVVGYEANGGFLIATDLTRGGKILKALPTRDAAIVLISILVLSIEKGKTIRELTETLPNRFTHSDRLKNFPSEKSKAKIAEISKGDSADAIINLETLFAKFFGSILSHNTTDGLRITFNNGEVIHFRPSGNAPEFRCYCEADTEDRAKQLVRACLDLMSGWL